MTAVPAGTLDPVATGDRAEVRVLLVDDELPLLRTLAINLRAHRYTVLVAASGEEAVELAARERPDVVVLDLGLPDLDGVEVISRLRGWSDVPILVLSGRSDSGDKVEALDAGADDYVTKPFEPLDLVDRANALLNR